MRFLSDRRGNVARGSKIAVVLVSVIALVECTNRPQVGNVEWEFSVPDGLPIITYSGTPPSARDRRHIELEESLLLGSGSDPDELLGSHPDVAIDDSGFMYIVEPKVPGIRVFDANGNLVRRVSGPGQGPDAINEPVAIAITGTRELLVADRRQARITRWSLAGDFLGPLAVEEPRLHTPMFGTKAGSVFFTGIVRGVEDMVRAQYFDAVLDGDPSNRRRLFLAELLTTSLRSRTLGSVAVMPMPGAHAPHFAVSWDGDAYFTTGSEYQVLAFGASGEPKWALSMRWPREPIPDELIRKRRNSLTAQYEAPPEGMPEVPTLHPAISQLAVDAEGRLYVYPYSDPTRTGAYREVDVYSAEGERIYSGWIGRHPWKKARNGFVYGWYVDLADSEWRLERWRLRSPF